MQSPAASFGAFVPPIALICTTFYHSIDEWRAQLALQMIAEARRLSIPFYAVDGSPSPVIERALSEAGAIIVKERDNPGKGKGFAYRTGIQAVLDAVADPSLVLCITEPEKVDLVRFLPSLAARVTSDGSNVILPHRSQPVSWAALPFEQYHSEQLGNRHLFNVARELDPPFSSVPYDWLFGPVLFHRSIAPYYLSYTGAQWDSQMVPYINAWAEGAAAIASVDIEYIHPAVQRAYEEYQSVWSAKRLQQLNVVIPAVEAALRRASAERQAKAGQR